MLHIYGIKNCNSVKKALTWLDEKGIDYTFHDFKKEGVTKDKLAEWEAAVGWEKLLNKRGTTWRKIAKEVQDSITGADAALELLESHTSAIKRPVIEHPRGVLIGFDEDSYQEELI